MVGLCRGLLRNPHEAEDAAQQAFLSAHGAFLRGADPDDPARWLTAIARNECLTCIRERMRRPLPVADADSAASSADPVAEAARRADIGALWRAVGELAPQQREALLLREFGGLSYDELAVALGVSVPAVESLLFRARTRLRMELRAAAAALSGLLPRLLAGGSAAKVAGGVTVAASLLTCGVVAGERQLRHHPAPPVRAESHPSSASILSDVPRTAAPIALPAARPARRQVDRPRPRAQSVRVVFTPPMHAPVPATDPSPAAAPTASDSGDTRTPVVATEDPSDATVAPDSSQQTTTDSSSGGGGSSGGTSSTTTTTTEPSNGSGTDGGSDSTTTTSDDGADSHP